MNNSVVNGGGGSVNGHVKKSSKVVIVGGGLVGSLNACFLAKRGFSVDLFEYRPDIRKTEHVRGKSINLSLSVRGLVALNEVGLSDKILAHGIPMYARMIHDRDGTLHRIPYGTSKQCIYSVGRRFLNEMILNETEKYSNVTCHFDHKLVHADLANGSVTFNRTTDGEDFQTTADLVIGCDGAFSAVRRQMLKEQHFNYSQKYIEHSYLELCMPPDEHGKHAMDANCLHIWPRNEFMMIALPNQDFTYTVTLFMPLSKFKSLDNRDTLLKFFREMYPDALSLIGESRLIEDFFSVPPSPLLTIKCSPYHVTDKAIIMGDAAHAMVPFYGQGMNCGFEDCYLFDQLLDQNDDKFGKVLESFSQFRNPDAEAICDLAIYNYIEMRHLVNTKAFIIRKKIDRFLNWMLPGKWIPLYSSVTFTRNRYTDCTANRAWQDRVLSRVGWGSTLVIVTSGIAFGIYWYRPQISRYVIKHLLRSAIDVD